MKPPAFEYLAPTSLEESLVALAEHGYDARPLAGGQSLVPMLNFRLARPAVLVDLNGVEELFGFPGSVEPDPEALRIGAMTRHAQVERAPATRELAPLVAECLPHVAHPPIRNRGTIGGSLAHADPAAELPAVALACEAILHLRSASGSREVPAADFFVGPFATVLEPDELVVEIEIPGCPAGAGWAFDEVARRRGDYALVGVAAVVELDADGVCTAARLGLVNAGPVPILAGSAAGVLEGSRPDPACIEAAADAAASDDASPVADVHASAEYRRALVRVITKRVLRRAFDQVSR